MISVYTKLSTKVEEHFSFLAEANQSLLREYFNYLIFRQYSPNTVETNLYCLHHFFEFMDEETPFSEVSKHDVRLFGEFLSEQDRSPSTINVHLNVLSSLFRFLIDEEYVDRNPVLRRYYVFKEIRLPRPIPANDLKIFLKTLSHPRDKGIFLLMLRTGLRVSEVLRLQMNHINWNERNLIVHNGKGRVDQVVYFSQDD